MTKHREFDISRFYHALPEMLVRRYLEGLAHEPPAGWASLNGDAFREWLQEPEQIEVEPLVTQTFRRINDMSGRHMNLVLEAYSKFEIQPELSTTPEARALELFVRSNVAFDYAWSRYLLFANADTLTDYVFPAKSIDIGPDAISSLKMNLARFFDERAKGRQCRVRAYRDGDEVVVSVQRGHYIKTVSMFSDESDEISYRSFRPAIDDVMVFDEHRHILRVKAGSRQEREAYMSMLAMLCPDTQEIIRAAKDSQVYTLAPLSDERFSYQGSGPIHGVRLVRAKYLVSPRGTVEYATEDVNALLEDYGPPPGPMVSASLMFAFRGKRGLRWMRADISPPSRGKLPDEFEDDVDRYLREQGVKLV